MMRRIHRAVIPIPSERYKVGLSHPTPQFSESAISALCRVSMVSRALLQYVFNPKSCPHSLTHVRYPLAHHPNEDLYIDFERFLHLKIDLLTRQKEIEFTLKFYQRIQLTLSS
jgi:hypothetical protein